MIDPTRLKSNVLRRIIADSQWEAGQSNMLAISARTACDTEQAEQHADDAESHRAVARLATAELINRKESLR